MEALEGRHAVPRFSFLYSGSNEKPSQVLRRFFFFLSKLLLTLTREWRLEESGRKVEETGAGSALVVSVKWSGPGGTAEVPRGSRVSKEEEGGTGDPPSGVEGWQRGSVG